MTIAAGFVCLNGIILCADSQETITGYTKNSTEKIRIWKDSGLGVAITGAGDAELIETIGAEIERAMTYDYSSDAVRFPDEVREIIQTAMSSGFRKYIAPYAPFPKDDRPWCELLILVSVKNKVNEYESLFKAAGTMVREITFGAECIGSGLILAKSLIERFYTSFLELDDAVLAALYILHQTKKWVDGCGGKTDILVSSIKQDLLTSLASKDIESIEKNFEKCERYVNSLIIGLLNPNQDQSETMRLVSLAIDAGKKATEAVYPTDSRLADLFKRFAVERSPMPSAPQSSEGH